MIQFHSLEVPQLERFLERHKAGLTLRSEVDLDLVLRQILQKAYEFVPSESGSILLDDPFRKVAVRRENELVFIATFGHASRDLSARFTGLLNTRALASFTASCRSATSISRRPTNPTHCAFPRNRATTRLCASVGIQCSIFP